MSESTVPPVTDAAVEAARRILGMPEDARPQVLLALATAAPHMVPPPQLPTTPGALIIAKLPFGERVLRLDKQGDLLALDGVTEYDAADLVGWKPAQVVPADEHGPVAVLRQAFEDLTTAAGGSLPDARLLAEDVALRIGVVLDRLDGGEPS